MMEAWGVAAETDASIFILELCCALRRHNGCLVHDRPQSWKVHVSFNILLETVPQSHAASSGAAADGPLGRTRQVILIRVQVAADVINASCCPRQH